jgi:chitinase
VIGLYAGARIHHRSASDLVERFVTQVGTQGNISSTLMQHCGSDGDHFLGMVVDSSNNLANVQRVVKDWDNATCATGFQDKATSTNSTIWLTGAPSTPIAPRMLSARATCKSIQAKSGDSCSSLSQKCGISLANFEKYNPGSTFCNTLQPNQWVCCSSGTLPDFSPKPNSDGSCASYLTKSGDYCAAIAATYSTTVAKLESYNKNTWGWSGCSTLLPNVEMCLSTGSPPMPFQISSVVCGPQVYGTTRPSAGTSLASLNPCALNACCDIWGQCGTTAEFCVNTTSSTGAPGTAAPGTNGCISNCGTEVVTSKTPPDVFRRVGYFESWNSQRSCLHMDVRQINLTQYTHIHFAFANITTDYKVDVSAVTDQFEAFKGLTGVKRIISFGGWSFSTGLDSYPIFRDAVTAANRATFAANVAQFVTDNGLDGADFDWEYPSATDIPGIPPGSRDEGSNYMLFLNQMRADLPAGKSLSIAAPASFWYLKGFPIKDMAFVLDYIIYMTYDLHGQWDFGNQFSDPGCPSGACLRSHINYTETVNALSMITKAGVPSNKVVVGVSSYGRAFKMTTPGCTTEMCTYTGKASGATPGKCTGTAGYLANYEIQDIIAHAPGVKQYFDTNSRSNIMVYNSTQWVAYMSDAEKATRVSIYELSVMGGVTDWAVDLQQDMGAYEAPIVDELPDCDATYTSIDDIISAEETVPDYCMNLYLSQAQSSTLGTALSQYKDILQQNYDSKFETYSRYVQELAPTQVDAFMASKADQYFTCTVTRHILCCKDCSVACSPCQGQQPCTTGYFNFTEPCPTEIPDAGTTYLPPTYYTLNDRDGFFNDLLSTYGIEEDWITFGSKIEYISPGCHPGSDGICPDNVYWQGYPLAINFQVPNPKDAVSSALDNITNFHDVLDSTILGMANYIYPGAEADVVDGASLPAFMTASAVASMQKVVDIGGEIQAEERKETILGFIMGILFLIPAAGTLAGDVGLASLSRIISLIGDTGNGALGIYGVVEDPQSALFLAFGAAMAARYGDGFEESATALREMSGKEFDSLGDDIKGPLRNVNQLKDACY